MADVITGRVDAIEAPAGQAKAYQITIGGKKYRTIKPEVYGGLVLGQTVEATVNEVPGKGTNPHTGQPYGPSWFLEGRKAVDKETAKVLQDNFGPGIISPVKSTYETADERAARNRSIAMQHSQSVAIAMVQAEMGLGSGGAKLLPIIRDIAHALYADVQRAWAGDNFSGDPVPREAAKNPEPSALDAHFGPKVTTGQIDGKGHQANVWVAAFDGATSFEDARKHGSEMPAEFRAVPAVMDAMKRAAERLKVTP